ncbi:MAG: hypothetical protein CFE34_01655 [Rhodobacteraceae bacterium PARR1]|nr:MAG: hypothetical protein CFE34_01655 [Rhodobacteraceae bacterium PARR1]
MSNTPHELHDEFPDQAQAIHALKAKDAHFARLLEEYHYVNRAVHRAETRVEPVSAEAESALRHKRMRLKDDIWKALQAA